MRRSEIVLALAALLAATSSRSQQPVLVRDINTARPGASPFDFAKLGTAVYFSAAHDDTGRELWRVDGGVTTLAADICPGRCSSNPQSLVELGGLLYFDADDGTTGRELWQTDGTTTTLVRDIHPGQDWSGASELALLDGRVLFSANDGVTGRELWVTDGSGPAGTRLLADIRAGGDDSSPSGFTLFDGQLYFRARDGAGDELWRTDGTDVERVIDLCPGACSSWPDALAEYDGLLYFSATDDELAWRLWRTDGTPANTVPIGPTVDYLQHLRVSSFGLYYIADDSSGNEPYFSDGTDPGTGRLGDICPGACDGVDRVYDWAVVGSTLFFVGNDGVSGPQLWASDGDSATTRAVRSFEDAGCETALWLDGPSELTALGDLLMFTAPTTSRGHEVWSSDGTVAGTQMLFDVAPGTKGSSPNELTVVDGALWWGADDGADGSQPWTSDGTAAGTRQAGLVSPLRSAPAWAIDLHAVGARLFFKAYTEAAGNELFTSDGTPGGTRLVRDILPGPCSGVASTDGELVHIDDTVYFFADDGIAGRELWRSDGTAAGTQMVHDICPGGCDGVSRSANLATLEQLVVFGANNGVDGTEAWVSDGSAAGTRLLRDIWVGPFGPEPQSFVQSGDRLYFTAAAPGLNYELWRTDGTPANTELAHDVCVGGCQGLPLFAPAQSAVDVDGNLVFVAADNPGDWELWRSDGTDAILIRDIHFGQQPSTPTRLTRSGFRVFFSATEYNGVELFVTDGTPGGTYMVKDLHETGSSKPSWLIDYGGEIFFEADDGVTGAELWKSAGLELNTEQVKDVNPGAASGSAADLVESGGLLYFVADDGSTGCELWTSDGTSASTRLVADLNPGPASGLGAGGGSDRGPGLNRPCRASELTDVDGVLYFLADDGTTGFELWKLDPAAPTYPLLRNTTLTTIDPPSAPKATLLPLTAAKDSYRPGFTSGSVDPDLSVLQDTGRPLVFYAIDGPSEILLVETADRQIHVFF